MVSLHIRFAVDGEIINRLAILNNDLAALSNSKLNQCGDIIDDTIYDGYWSLVFYESDILQYEVQLEFDNVAFCKTFNPVKCIIWENDLIYDVVNVIVRYGK